MSMPNQNDRTIEQGCCLDEATRLEYLNAMDIQPWCLKHQPDAPLQITSLPDDQVSAVDDSHQPEVSDVVDKPVTTDISSLGWESLKQVVSQCQLCEL
ncbi:MAG: hypothetical protein OEY87_04830, partial [Gammaproteobacteria bacterium]|nr:hypothetical protein [Gammaproteobacteria bacterium]